MCIYLIVVHNKGSETSHLANRMVFGPAKFKNEKIECQYNDGF